jgi:hypothetical protein
MAMRLLATIITITNSTATTTTNNYL